MSAETPNQKAWIEVVGDTAIMRFDPEVSKQAMAVVVAEIGREVTDMVIGAPANDETICRVNAVIAQAWHRLTCDRVIYFQHHCWMGKTFFDYLEP